MFGVLKKIYRNLEAVFCSKNPINLKKPKKPTGGQVLLFFRWVFLGFIGQIFLTAILIPTGMV